jgi:protein subunit release factor B
MKFPADAPVTRQKLETLRERIARLNVDLGAVDETFVRGSGPGGQKINKTSIGVQLRYAPLELVVKCAKERSRALNRFLALRELVDQVEMREAPESSQRLAQRDKIRKQKRRRARRSKQRNDNNRPQD